MTLQAFDLAKLDSNTFEQIVNALAMRVLGAGHTGFGPGADGGRDGYFEGEAPYPSAQAAWNGIWYIQSKFLAPHLAKDPQKWLIAQVQSEIALFEKPGSNRSWPNNWIIATNVDPSGTPNTGSFDVIRRLVHESNPGLDGHVHIWGGRKIIEFLSTYPEVSRGYSQFITPSHILNKIYDTLSANNADVKDIIRNLIVTQFEDQQYTKLEQAGSESDSRPKIHDVFVDLPYHSPFRNRSGQQSSYRAYALHDLLRASARVINLQQDSETEEWADWSKLPQRARVWFVKGGPGQGKSTLMQYFCHIQRAAIIIGSQGLTVNSRVRSIANEVRKITQGDEHWPNSPRIPVLIELRDYAAWYSNTAQEGGKGVLTYLSSRLTAKVEAVVQPNRLRDAFSTSRWAFIFDGLDEVPSDSKDLLAAEISYFVNNVIVGINADALVICTSRPQGYSNHFAPLDPVNVNLSQLNSYQALSCARPILAVARSQDELRNSLEILQEALRSTTIQEIMKTPLQCHIMAVVVRDGERPPERKWNLFAHFYKTIRRREANKNHADRRIAKLLREGEKLLKAIHNRLGLELHVRAELSKGAQTSLDRDQLKPIFKEVVKDLQDSEIDETVDLLWEATTERLVLVNTPENSKSVRFDVRQFQEFFAAECISEPQKRETFYSYVTSIAEDAHWREVMHFLVSGLVENERIQELSLIVTVLQSIDSGLGLQKDGVLAALLAIGGSISARLMQEGVLEQDRRFRMQFRPCLDKLNDSMDAWIDLANVRPFYTQQWMDTYLVEELRKRRFPSNLGTASASALTRNISKDLEAEILSIAKSEDVHLRESLTHRITWHSELGDSKSLVTRHLVCIIIEVLKRYKSNDALASILPSVFQTLKTCEDLRDAFAESGFSTEVVSLLVAIFKGDVDQTAPFETLVSRQFGFIDWRRMEIDANFDLHNFSTEISQELKDAGGFFKILSSALDCACGKSGLEFEQYHDAHLAEGGVRQILPEVISNLFDNPADLKLHVLDRPMPNGHRKLSIVRPEVNAIIDQVDWSALIPQNLDFALILLKGEFGNRNGKSLAAAWGEETMQLAIDAAEKDPRRLIYCVDRWRWLVESTGSFSARFRQAIRMACDDLPEVQYHRRQGAAFQINLPSEGRILVHLLAASARGLFGNSVLRYGGETVSSDDAIVELQQFAEKISPASEPLERAAADPSIDKVERAAALICALFHRRTPADVKKRLTGYVVHLSDARISWWYIPCAALLFNDAVEKLREDQCAILGSLIASGGQSKDIYEMLSPLIRNWREVSRAPVSRSLTSQNALDVSASVK